MAVRFDGWLNIDQVRRVTLSDWIDPMWSDILI